MAGLRAVQRPLQVRDETAGRRIRRRRLVRGFDTHHSRHGAAVRRRRSTVRFPSRFAPLHPPASRATFRRCSDGRGTYFHGIWVSTDKPQCFQRIGAGIPGRALSSQKSKTKRASPSRGKGLSGYWLLQYAKASFSELLRSSAAKDLSGLRFMAATKSSSSPRRNSAGAGPESDPACQLVK